MKKIILFSVIIISCLYTTTYAQTREIDANELATSLMPQGSISHCWLTAFTISFSLPMMLTAITS